MSIMSIMAFALVLCNAGAVSVPPELLVEVDASKWPESKLYRTTVLEPKCKDLLSDYGKRFVRHLV